MELVQNTPLVTLSIIVVCIIVHIAILVGDYGTSRVQISPYFVVNEGQLWRVVTAAFVHGGMLHIGMNMLSLFSLGQSLEQLFGSLHFFFLILNYILLCGLFYIALAFVASYVWSGAAWYVGAVGFSGVLFALAVDESSLSPFPSRSVFGLFSVPTKLYPWVLMLVIQLILPGVSFMGHLAGIGVGMLHTAGYLRFVLPSLPTLRKMEEFAWMRWIKRSPMYKLVPNSDVVMERNSSESTLRVAGRWLAHVLAPLTQCIARRLPQGWVERASGLFSRGGGSGGNARAGATAGGGAGTPRPARVVDDSGRLRAAAAPQGASAGGGGGGTGGATAPPAAGLLPPSLPAAHGGVAAFFSPTSGGSSSTTAAALTPTPSSMAVAGGGDSGVPDLEAGTTHDLAPGRVESSAGGGGGGILGAMAGMVGGNSYGYDRLASTEENADAEQEEQEQEQQHQRGVPAGAGGGMGAAARPDAAVAASREEARAKLLAAAEARAAAAKAKTGGGGGGATTQ